MRENLSSKQYVPTKVEILQVQVERGFGLSDYTPPYSGGGSTTDDPLYDFGGSLDDLTHGDL